VRISVRRGIRIRTGSPIVLVTRSADVLTDSLAPPKARNRAGNWVNSGYNAGSSAGAALSGQLVGWIPLSACLPVLAAPALLAVVPLLRARLTQ
jgi:predicted MFS family arabinose efflux permease